MRRQILLTVAAATSVVLLAFLAPLLVLVQDVATNRATSAASLAVQSLVPVVSALDPDTLALAVAQVDAATPGAVSVVLPDGTVVGAPTTVDDSVALARSGSAFVLQTPSGGRDVLAPVITSAGTAVIRVAVPESEVTRGVLASRAALLGLAVVVMGLALLLADRLARRILTPVNSAAAVAHRLAGGDLEARVVPAGPPEVEEVGHALNLLGGRIDALLQGEREQIADLSHRLRTPITALRLDVDGLPDGEARERLSADVDRLGRHVDDLITEARRPSREGVLARADATAVVGEQAAFWAVLAEEEGRPMTTALPSRPALVRLDEQSLRDVVDALLGNVFAHTPEGTALGVRLTVTADGVVLEVVDAGPGLAAIAAGRGVSGAGSTGLGLDIVRRSAEVSGGSLQIGTSDLGGAAIRVRLGRPDPNAM